MSLIVYVLCSAKNNYSTEQGECPISTPTGIHYVKGICRFYGNHPTANFTYTTSHPSKYYKSKLSFRTKRGLTAVGCISFFNDPVHGQGKPKFQLISGIPIG